MRQYAGDFDTEIGSFAILDETTEQEKVNFLTVPRFAKYIYIDDKYPEYENREAEKSQNVPI